jgi:hypothetical protein
MIVRAAKGDLSGAIACCLPMVSRGRGDCVRQGRRRQLRATVLERKVTRNRLVETGLAVVHKSAGGDRRSRYGQGTYLAPRYF